VHVLYVGRHQFLRDHVVRLWTEFGVATDGRVGLDVDEEPRSKYDAVLCDYDLLASMTPEECADCPTLRDTPIIATSLTHRADELPVLGLPGVVGFLYLPALTREAALAALDEGRGRKTLD
jgi:hypothetical protein